VLPAYLYLPFTHPGLEALLWLSGRSTQNFSGAQVELRAVPGAGGEELVVEREDLAPVGLGGGWRVAVHGVDRGLDLVGAWLAFRRRHQRTSSCPSWIRLWSQRLRSCSGSGTS
jgi:hypothetical protein